MLENLIKNRKTLVSKYPNEVEKGHAIEICKDADA